MGKRIDGVVTQRYMSNGKDARDLNRIKHASSFKIKKEIKKKSWFEKIIDFLKKF